MDEILTSASLPSSVANHTKAPSPWLTADEAANRARVSTKSIYAAVRAGRLRSALIGGRRSHRFLEAWVDAWLEADAKPIEVITRAASLRVAR